MNHLPPLFLQQRRFNPPGGSTKGFALTRRGLNGNLRKTGLWVSNDWGKKSIYVKKKKKKKRNTD